MGRGRQQESASEAMQTGKAEGEGAVLLLLTGCSPREMKGVCSSCSSMSMASAMLTTMAAEPSSVRFEDGHRCLPNMQPSVAA